MAIWMFQAERIEGSRRGKMGENKQLKQNNTETFLISLTTTVLGGWQWVL